MEILALFLVSLVAAIGLACAIQYFFIPGPWRSLGYAMFAVALFLAFWASGLWQDASRHDWGFLTPVFAFMGIGGWLSLKFGKKIWDYWQNRRTRQD